MKKLLFLLLFASACFADPDFNGTTNIGLASASSVTYSTNIVSVSVWAYIRRTNANYQFIVDSSTALASATASTPRFVLGIGSRSSKYVLECLARGSFYRSQYILAAPNLDLNKWYHIGAVFDCSTSAGNFKLYLNGTNQTLTTDATLNNMGTAGTPNTVWQANTFCVASENTNAVPFNGTISELAIWNKELSAAQFFQLSQRMPVTSIGVMPIVYWPMHTSDVESPGDLIARNTLSKGVYTKTNNSPGILQP